MILEQNPSPVDTDNMDAPGAYLEAGNKAGAECREAALHYLSLGWSVLALCPPDHVGMRLVGHDCQSPGKRPWHPWKHHQDHLATPEQVRDWWERVPAGNVGMALGPVSGLVRVDVDGIEGERRLQEVSGGDLPPTLEFATPRRNGGRGLLYRIPPGVELRTTSESHKEKSELRFQAKGAQTVLPPSRHESGGRYAWMPGHGPGYMEAAPCPPWLLAVLAVDVQLGNRPGPLFAPENVTGQEIPDGRRDDTLTSMAGSMRAAGFDEPAIFAALQDTNEHHCAPPLDEKQVRKIAHSIGKKPSGAVPGVTIKVNGNGNGNGHAATGVKEQVRQPKLTRLSTVDPKDVKWLWPLWLPWHFLTILDGDPGLGKSMISLDLAARITTGLPMPFDDTVAWDRQPGGVVVLTAEDSLDCTVRPRLDAAGADPSRVFAFEATWDGDTADSEKPPEIPWDLDMIKPLILEEDVRLVIVDPLMAYLGEQVDAHKDQSIRRCLHLLKGFAEANGICLWVLRHLNKLAGGPAKYRGGGSIGIIGGARTSWIVGTDPDNRNRHVLAMNKSNLGPFPESLVYRIVPAGKVAKVEWLETTDLSADDILSHPQAEKVRELDGAVRFVQDQLANGTVMLTEDLVEAGRANGLSVRTIERARKQARVQARRRMDGKWEVFLPLEPGNLSNDVPENDPFP